MNEALLAFSIIVLIWSIIFWIADIITGRKS
jgi:hypothetical protein